MAPDNSAHTTGRMSMAAAGGTGGDQIENIPPTVTRSRLQPPTSRLSMPAPSAVAAAAYATVQSTNNQHNNNNTTVASTAAAAAAASAAAASAAAAAAAVAAANAQATGGGGTGPAARRSYVVKEVERLKENREKRRARQAEIKEEKVALMNQDPGNPNWELAAMIRYGTLTIELQMKLLTFGV